MLEFRRKLNLEVVMTFFWKISAKFTNFEVSNIRIFDEVSISTTSLPIVFQHYSLTPLQQIIMQLLQKVLFYT